jgi:hypothetical protein
MKNRPKKPQGYRQDGDDLNTRTKYQGPEYCLGDAMKVVLLQVYDMLEYDNLQKHEIKALLNATVDEHVREIDELTGEIS